jgi:mRNA interferase MazF
VVVLRGEVWWTDLADPAGSEPGGRRPALIVQSDISNRSRIGIVIVVVLTTSVRRLDAPENSLITRRESGLPKDSDANVSQLLTIDMASLLEPAGHLSRSAMNRVAGGLRLVLSLV